MLLALTLTDNYGYDKNGARTRPKMDTTLEGHNLEGHNLEGHNLEGTQPRRDTT